MLQEDRLADNYPLLIAANMEIYRERLEKIAVKFIKEGKTGFFDSHPCDKDRIAAATELALAVEEALELEPLPVPPPPEDEEDA